MVFDFGFGYDLDYNGFFFGVVMWNIGLQMFFGGSGLQVDFDEDVPLFIDVENFELLVVVNFLVIMNMVDMEMF